MHPSLAYLPPGSDVGLILFLVSIPFVLFLSLMVLAILLKRRRRKIGAIIAAAIGLVALVWGMANIHCT